MLMPCPITLCLKNTARRPQLFFEYSLNNSLLEGAERLSDNRHQSGFEIVCDLKRRAVFKEHGNPTIPMELQKACNLYKEFLKGFGFKIGRKALSDIISYEFYDWSIIDSICFKTKMQGVKQGFIEVKPVIPICGNLLQYTIVMLDVGFPRAAHVARSKGINLSAAIFRIIVFFHKFACPEIVEMYRNSRFCFRRKFYNFIKGFRLFPEQIKDLEFNRTVDRY
jgi:hypothetical protein